MKPNNTPLAIPGMRKPLLGVPGGRVRLSALEGRGLKDHEGQPMRSVSSNRQKRDALMKLESIFDTIQRMNRLEMP